MGRLFSGSRREVLVFLDMHRESALQNAHRNIIALDLQCACRCFLARKRVMEERMGRPMRLIRRLRWHQEVAAAKIQKWLLLFNAGRLVRGVKRARACSILQCNLGMWRARRQYQAARRASAAVRIQYFWRIQVPMRMVPWRRRRLIALMRLQRAMRCVLARRRMAEAHESCNLKQAWRWQAASFAVPIIRHAYRAYCARRRLQQVVLLGHIQHLSALVTRVVRGHFDRRAVRAHTQQYMVKLQAARAVRVQCALRQYWARQALRRRLAHQMTRHRFAFHLQAAVRRTLRRACYKRQRSGDTAAECVQRAWHQRLARKGAAAAKLKPFFNRATATKISPFFLVRLAERKAGLAPGSICLHCLISVAGGQSSLACTSQFFASKSSVVGAAGASSASERHTNNKTAPHMSADSARSGNGSASTPLADAANEHAEKGAAGAAHVRGVSAAVAGAGAVAVGAVAGGGGRRALRARLLKP